MEFDVTIIGAGPGGYTAANLCAKNGLKVAIIEKEKIGGVCLNIGCIPTKSLINIAEYYSKIKNNNEISGIKIENATIDRVTINKRLTEISTNIVRGIEFLFKKYGVVIYKGEAKIIDKNTVLVNNEIIKTKKIIIATGSKNKDYSFLLKDNNSPNILTSTEALFLEKIPESITIIGGGAIGVEFAYIFNAFGSNVTLLEYFPVLLYNMDEECGKSLERIFRKNKIKTIVEAKVLSISSKENYLSVKYQKNGEELDVLSEYVLVAMGRSPNTKNLNLEGLNVATKNGFILVNEFMQTTNPDIYAVGDVVAESPLLAHVAYREAKIASYHILNKDVPQLDRNLIPFCIYTEPQISGFGLTESKAKSLYPDCKILKIFLKSNGKANAIDKTEGFIKIVTHKDKIIGCWILGVDATEIIHNLLLVSTNDLTIDRILNVIYAHPSISETIFDIVQEEYD
ncbi:MAG TPA: dihydrolipoyl dehydrogenase [Spirochaetota bacterium]|nr:dihydrolipoyl dehydrogenase [Spirochaetota bacterium]HPP03255.1 dihydrolipoyl dehydrogenase [Spirochaetota bacterium]